MALQREIVELDVGVGADIGDDLGDVGLDHLEAELARDGDAVVAVADEVQRADPVDVDRRHRLAAAHRLRDPLPALPRAALRGPKLAVELARAVDGADDRVEVDGLQAEPALAAPPERRDDLVEGQDVVDVVGLAAEPAREVGRHLAAASAREVTRGVGARESGIHRHSRLELPTRRPVLSRGRG